MTMAPPASKTQTDCGDEEKSSFPSPMKNGVVSSNETAGASKPMNGHSPNQLCLSFSSRNGDGFASVVQAAKVFEMANAKLIHVESRASAVKEDGFEFLVKCDANGCSTKSLMASLQKSVDSVVLHREEVPSEEVWYPRHISDLDKCKHLIPGFTPDVDLDHPGHEDKEYCARRMDIAGIAFRHRYGNPIGRVDYTDEDTKTWANVYRQVAKLFPTHASKEHIAGLRELEDVGLYSPDFVPQLEDVSNFLKETGGRDSLIQRGDARAIMNLLQAEKSGFQLRPVAGLLTARDFLASLAFRTFQTTQYIRHHSSPEHTPEPDCCHELLGHVPMLGDPAFAQFSQEIGLASLGASDDDIVKLARLYWFTVEVGLCKEADQVRIYGAALLSSPGETVYALSDKPERVSFEASKVATQTFDEKYYQPIFFVTESFEDAKQQLRSYTNTMKKPFDVRYDPYTKRIITLDSVDNVRDIARDLKSQLSTVVSALEKITAR